MRDLHDRICRELAERFENTHALTDGSGYRFHATIVLGEPAQVYQKIYAEYQNMKVDLRYIAKEIAMFCSVGTVDESSAPPRTVFDSCREQPFGPITGSVLVYAVS